MCDDDVGDNDRCRDLCWVRNPAAACCCTPSRNIDNKLAVLQWPARQGHLQHVNTSSEESSCQPVSPAVALSSLLCSKLAVATSSGFPLMCAATPSTVSAYQGSFLQRPTRAGAVAQGLCLPEPHSQAIVCLACSAPHCAVMSQRCCCSLQGHQGHSKCCQSQPSSASTVRCLTEQGCKPESAAVACRATKGMADMIAPGMQPLAASQPNNTR